MKNKKIDNLIIDKLKEEKLLNEFNFKTLFTSSGKELINAESKLANNLVKLSNTINTSAKTIDSLIEKFNNTPRENISEGDFAIVQAFLTIDQDLDRKKTLQKVLNDINAIVKEISPLPWFQKLGVSEKALYRLGIISVACKMAGQETDAKPQEEEQEGETTQKPIQYKIKVGNTLPFQAKLEKGNDATINKNKFIVIDVSDTEAKLQNEETGLDVSLKFKGEENSLFNYEVVDIEA
jgi:hypothetical protein